MIDTLSVTEAVDSIKKNLPEQQFYDTFLNKLPDESFYTSLTQGLEANTEAIKLFIEKFEQKTIDPSASTETLTEKAFKTVKGVRDNLEDLYSYVEKFSKDKNPSTASLFEMQYKVIQMSVLMDISSKVGDKASQGFQTLFRNQG